MKRVIIATAAAIVGLTTSAHAGGLEKVDMVKEGIDQAPAIVRANGSGYTSYENNSHKYFVRVYAKAKGGDRVYWAGVSAARVGPFQPNGTFARQDVGKSEGWAVYNKSLSFNASFGDTHWWDSPKEACERNMQDQIKKGMKKSDVLKREWKTTARAIFYFVAAADSKSHNKKNKHESKKIHVKDKSLSYPINVVCRTAL